MDKTIRTHLDNIRSQDRELQNEAFSYILKKTEKPWTGPTKRGMNLLGA